MSERERIAIKALITLFNGVHMRDLEKHELPVVKELIRADVFMVNDNGDLCYVKD